MQTAGQPNQLPFSSVPNNTNNQPLSNENLRPERSGILDLGIDFAITGGRLNGTFDYYDRRTTDLLAPDLLDPTTGYLSSTVNTANLRSRGVEFSLNSVNVIASKFRWNSTLLHSWNRVKVTKLYVTGARTIFDVINGIPNYDEGYDLSRIFSFRWAGLSPNGDPQGYLNGSVVPITNNTPGRISYLAIGALPKADAKFHGSSVPVHAGYLRNTFTYSSFTISANISYKLGYYFRKPEADILNYGALYNNNLLQSADFNDRWQKPGDELSTNVPSIAYSTSSSDARNSFYKYAEINVFKADHIRLQEINLNYAFNPTKRWFLKNANVYANISNLGLLWRANRQGLDPDTYDYPQPRQYGFGLRANF